MIPLMLSAVWKMCCHSVIPRLCYCKLSVEVTDEHLRHFSAEPDSERHRSTVGLRCFDLGFFFVVVGEGQAQRRVVCLYAVI